VVLNPIPLQNRYVEPFTQILVHQNWDISKRQLAGFDYDAEIDWVARNNCLHTVYKNVYPGLKADDPDSLKQLLDPHRLRVAHGKLLFQYVTIEYTEILAYFRYFCSPFTWR
jgi:hypothetical protein